MKKTKIVATISDKRCEVEFLEKLYRAGMNVVRLNTAHQDMEHLDRHEGTGSENDAYG